MLKRSRKPSKAIRSRCRAGKRFTGLAKSACVNRVGTFWCLPNESASREQQLASSDRCRGKFHVRIDCSFEFRDADVFIVGVRDVHRSGAEEVGRTPVRERRKVG